MSKPAEAGGEGDRRVGGKIDVVVSHYGDVVGDAQPERAERASGATGRASVAVAMRTGFG
jgi:hypothetical protein